MEPSAATVLYRYGDSHGGKARDASFRGLFFDRSEAAVLGRLREVHRFAAWVEVVEVRWRRAGQAAPVDGEEGEKRQDRTTR